MRVAPRTEPRVDHRPCTHAPRSTSQAPRRRYAVSTRAKAARLEIKAHDSHAGAYSSLTVDSRSRVNFGRVTPLNASPGLCPRTSPRLSPASIASLRPRGSSGAFGQGRALAVVNVARAVRLRWRAPPLRTRLAAARALRLHARRCAHIFCTRRRRALTAVECRPPCAQVWAPWSLGALPALPGLSTCATPSRSRPGSAAALLRPVLRGARGRCWTIHVYNTRCIARGGCIIHVYCQLERTIHKFCIIQVTIHLYSTTVYTQD